MGLISEFSDDLGLAHVLADDADGLTMSRFRAQDLRVDTKPDMTPVTDADRSVEEIMRTTLQRVRAADSVYGEEFGRSGEAERCWVLDPIDGTKSFVRGVPVWASLIALMVGEEVVVAVASAPALGRRWWAIRGGGTFAGRGLSTGAPCHVSKVTILDDASLSFSSIKGWEEKGRLDGFLELNRRCWRGRAYGDFWSHVLVAEGVVDVSCEPEVDLYDLAAVSLIVEEAGGRFTGVDGRPGPAGGSAVATNGHLHDDVLDLLALGR